LCCAHRIKCSLPNCVVRSESGLRCRIVLSAANLVFAAEFVLFATNSVFAAELVWSAVNEGFLPNLWYPQRIRGSMPNCVVRSE
jgi:hypothetical protein